MAYALTLQARHSNTAPSTHGARIAQAGTQYPMATSHHEGMRPSKYFISLIALWRLRSPRRISTIINRRDAVRCGSSKCEAIARHAKSNKDKLIAIEDRRRRAANARFTPSAYMMGGLMARTADIHRRQLSAASCTLP